MKKIKFTLKNAKIYDNSMAKKPYASNLLSKPNSVFLTLEAQKPERSL